MLSHIASAIKKNIKKKNPISREIYAMFIRSRTISSSSFFTNRPFTLSLESAKFLRTSYLTRFVQTRSLRFLRNRSIRRRRDFGEYFPTIFFTPTFFAFFSVFFSLLVEDARRLVFFALPPPPFAVRDFRVAFDRPPFR